MPFAVKPNMLMPNSNRDNGQVKGNDNIRIWQRASNLLIVVTGQVKSSEIKSYNMNKKYLSEDDFKSIYRGLLNLDRGASINYVDKLG